MAESAQYRLFSAELNKFNKSQLIDIIIRKMVPEGVQVSEELQKCILSPPMGPEVEESDTISFKNKEEAQNYKEISDSLQRELNVSAKLIHQLEERVNDQKLIISLLKTDQFSNEIHNKNNKQTEKENSSKIRQYEGNNQGEKKLSVPDKRHMEKRDIFQRQISVRTEKSDNKLDDDKWEIPRYRRRTNRREKRVYGKATDIEFKGVVKYKDYHFYRLPPNFQVNDLVDHLKSKNINDIKCEKMNSKYPDEYSSYKVSVAWKYEKEFTNPNIWPEYVSINPFLRNLGQGKRDA